MGKRGPAPTPTEVLQGRGSRLADQRVREGAPRVKLCQPKPPAWLRSHARRYWDDVCAATEALKVLSESDATAVAMLCDAIADYTEYQDSEPIQKTTTGRSMVSAEFQIKQEAWKRIVKGCSMLGLSPADRGSVRPGPSGADESSPIDKIMSRRRSAQ